MNTIIQQFGYHCNNMAFIKNIYRDKVSWAWEWLKVILYMVYFRIKIRVHRGKSHHLRHFVGNAQKNTCKKLFLELKII